MRYLVLPLALLLTGCDIDLDDVHGHREEEPFQYTQDFTPGNRLVVDNYNGSIEITGWDQPKIEVAGTKYASTKERLGEIKIDIQKGAGTVTVRTVPPITRHGNHGARYIIRVPRKATLELVKSTNGSVRVTDVDGDATTRTTNGTIRIAKVNGQVSASSTNGNVECIDVFGPVAARTTNGRIKLDGVSGGMDASTTNGSINASMTKSIDDRKMRFSTTNGSIDLQLPAGLKNDVRASTTNGSIGVKLPSSASFAVSARTTGSSVRSEFDVRGDITKKRIDGKVGAGGPMLDLSTSNGGISLQRGV